ncbi:MAG: TonB-dependent receptor [Rhodothermales bacterium]
MLLYTHRSTVLFVLLLLVSRVSFAQSPAGLAGRVTDGDDGIPLFGASVILTTPEGGIVRGVVANEEGHFQIDNLDPGDYRLEVHFVAYIGFELALTLEAGEVRTIHAALTPENVNINTIVVTASRGKERVLDSPASVTVIDSEEIEQDVSLSPIASLRNITGVDLAQTAVDRNQIALRGFNAANINSNVFLLNDYRPAVGAEGVAFYSIMSSSSIDLDRIEVVRGPASALYGAGGDAGVVHFISKSPFDYPGTSLSATAGQRSMLAGQYRHAGVIKDRLGYKLVANYDQARELSYDLDEAADADVLAQEVIVREPDYAKTQLDGMLEYLAGDDLTLTFNVGYSELTGFLLTDIAPFQVDKMIGYYGQVRVQAGSLFGQVYANMRDAGTSFAYTALRPIIQEGGRYGGQLQYEHLSLDRKTRLIVGADADLIRLASSGTLTGRNELSDDITLLGGYAQTSVDISKEIDLSIALRGDWSNVYAGIQLSPRAAFLYKPTPRHTLRAAFNTAFAAPTAFQSYLDFVIQEQTLNDAGYQFLVMGRGAVDGYTYDTYRATGQARLLLPVGSFLGQDYSVGAMPIAPIYGAAAGGGLIDLLRSTAPLPGLALSDTQRQLVADLLAQSASAGFTGAEVTSAGVLGLPDASERGFKEVASPSDTRPLEQTTTRSLELGYKGVIADDVLLTVDVYYANKKNFVGPLTLSTPFVYLNGATLTGDVSSVLSSLFQTTTDPAMRDLLDQLAMSGLSTEQVTGLLSNLVGQAMNDQSIAVVQTDQTILQPGTPNAIGALATFQNFGNIDYWGTDISVEIYTDNQVSLFGNVSVVSDGLFDYTQLGEGDPSLELALNAPTFKAKFGLGYTTPKGVSLNVFGRYANGYPVRSGRLFGEVEPAALFDFGISYSLDKYVAGLRFDTMIQNVFNTQHRQFIGAPPIGRMALARLTFELE